MTSRFTAGISGAGGKYAAGVAGVTQNPMVLAAARVDDGTWASNTTAAAARMSAKLKSVSLTDWQAAVASYGSSRYTSSATKAGAHYGARAGALAASAAAASTAAMAIPKSDPLGRVRAAINAQKSAWGKPTI
jgi:hypothetical protein